MADDLPASLFRQWLGAERSRPLGDAQLSSGRTLQPFSRALHLRADNLLAKASAALVDGNEERCTSYASRAAALPYDEHQETHPAVWSAFMTLFDEVVEAAEAADDKDLTWLTTALAVLRRSLGAGAVGLGHALDTVSRDYTLLPRETKLIRQAVAHTGPEPDFGLTRESPAETVRDVVLSLLRTNAEYHAALYH